MSTQKRVESRTALVDLSGKWTEEEAAEFTAATAPFGQIEWVLWAMEPLAEDPARAG